jgi:anti-anti-sigma factor
VALDVRDLDVTATDATDFRVEEECPRPGLVIVAVHGDLDLHSAGELGDRLVGVVDRGAASLVVDLSGVPFVDSQGLGALLRGTRRFGSGKEHFRLVVPAPEVRRLFELTALDQVFPLDRTRDEALAHAAVSDGLPRGTTNG